MQRIPVELHGRIFVACLPNETYVGPIGSQAPQLLLQVCRRWRSVALGTPELWRSLDAVQDLGGEGLDVVRREEIDFYSAWLSRSGSFPLSLAVSFADDDHWNGDEWLEAVRRYRERFERLRIIDEACVDMKSLLEGAKNLRHLTIEARSAEGPPTVVLPPPCLETLVLFFHHASPGTFLSGGWENLTGLAVRLGEVICEVDEFLGVLDRCPNVERLIFGPIDTINFVFPSPLRVRPKLRELTLLFDGGDLDYSAPVLALPGLESLRLSHQLDGGLQNLEEAVSSDPATEHFRLQDAGSLSGQGLAGELLPPERTCRVEAVGCEGTLCMFDLDWSNIAEVVLTASSNTDVFGTILSSCPNLVSLSVYGSKCTDSYTSLTAPLNHPKLSFIAINVWAELGNFLSMATLPGLRKFAVLALSYGEPEDVRAFLSRSRCRLETISLQARGSRGWTEAEQAELIEMMPTLTEVDLH